MTDRQKDDEYTRARKLAYNINSGRLDRIRNGSDVLKNLYDYSRLMREHGFNPDSREHCLLIAETLEQRLEQEKSAEMITENKDYLLGPEKDGIMVYTTSGASGVDEKSYKSECKRIKSELEGIFKQFYHSGLFEHEWEEDIFNETNARYYLRIKSGKQQLNINQVFRSNNSACSHGFMDIKIYDDGIFRFMPKADYYACGHIMNKAMFNSDEMPGFYYAPKQAYLFYTKRSKMPNGEERLNYYFSFFRLLPDKLKQICVNKVNMLP